jgi:epoxyqueuosine reductase
VTDWNAETVGNDIITKALNLGASLAGIAAVNTLKKAPSFTVTPLMKPYSGVGANKEKKENLKEGEVDWPEKAKSVIVVAYSHPQEHPELDYWYGSIDPLGNKELVRIVNELTAWLSSVKKVNAVHLPYHIERGGIYLKDAAVYAGMGCIGINNMLITPQFGPRVRLRGLAVDFDLPSTGVIDYDPCNLCSQPCKNACPQAAFHGNVYSEAELGRSELPGRDGSYNRLECNLQMKKDEEVAIEQKVQGLDGKVRVVKYCRLCEFACPEGRG